MKRLARLRNRPDLKAEHAYDEDVGPKPGRVDRESEFMTTSISTPRVRQSISITPVTGLPATSMQSADEFESDCASTALESQPTATIARKPRVSVARGGAAGLVVETISDEDGLRALEPEWIALE